MQIWLADPLLGGAVQSGRHLVELLAAFGLTAIIGLERTVQGKVAGLRTQTIVGTSSALIMLVSKYGFSDVLSAQTVELDPSRVAAQVVSGIGFWAQASSSLVAARFMGSPPRRRSGNPPRSAWRQARACYC
jgi:putative Mg2+ transporter-C (MgtC) family protein